MISVRREVSFAKEGDWRRYIARVPDAKIEIRVYWEATKRRTSAGRGSPMDTDRRATATAGATSSARASWSAPPRGSRWRTWTARQATIPTTTWWLGAALPQETRLPRPTQRPGQRQFAERGGILRIRLAQ
jgi:hypothetical protein